MERILWKWMNYGSLSVCDSPLLQLSHLSKCPKPPWQPSLLRKHPKPRILVWSISRAPHDALVIPVDCALPQAVYLYVSWHVITGSGDSSLGSHSEWRRVIKELEGDVYTHKLWFFSWGVDHDNKPWTDSWEPYVKIKCQDDIELMFSGYKKQTRMGFNLWGLNGFLEKERNQRVNQVFTIYIARNSQS